MPRTESRRVRSPGCISRYQVLECPGRGSARENRQHRRAHQREHESWPSGSVHKILTCSPGFATNTTTRSKEAIRPPPLAKAPGVSRRRCTADGRFSGPPSRKISDRQDVGRASLKIRIISAVHRPMPLFGHAPGVPEREPHQPRRGRGDLRGDRAVVGRPHRLGRRDQPRPDGVRRDRRRGRRLDHRALGWDLGLGLLGAGLVGAAVATLIGLPVLRRRGLTIAVITLSFSLMTTAWLLNPQFFGEGARFDWLPPARIERTDLFGFIDLRSETRYYFLCLVALGLAIIAVRGIRRSRTRAC